MNRNPLWQGASKDAERRPCCYRTDSSPRSARGRPGSSNKRVLNGWSPSFFLCDFHEEVLHEPENLSVDIWPEREKSEAPLQVVALDLHDRCFEEVMFDPRFCILCRFSEGCTQTTEDMSVATTASVPHTWALRVPTKRIGRPRPPSTYLELSAEQQPQMVESPRLYSATARSQQLIIINSRDAVQYPVCRNEK